LQFFLPDPVHYCLTPVCNEFYLWQNAGTELSRLEFLKALDEFDELKTVIKGLSVTYGLYMMVQMMAMIVCSTTSLFFLFTFHDRGGWIIYIASVFCYCCWLYWTCNGAEFIKDTVNLCFCCGFW